jgi:hypothetical protein
VLEQLRPVHEIGGRRFAVAEKFLGLIIPMAAILVIANTKRDDGI